MCWYREQEGAKENHQLNVYNVEYDRRQEKEPMEQLMLNIPLNLSSKNLARTCPETKWQNPLASLQTYNNILY